MRGGWGATHGGRAAYRAGSGVIFDVGGDRVFLDRLDAFFGAGLGGVALAGGDNLPVRGLQMEPVLAGVVFLDLELGGHALSPSGSECGRAPPCNGYSPRVNGFLRP